MKRKQFVVNTQFLEPIITGVKSCLRWLNKLPPKKLAISAIIIAVMSLAANIWPWFRGDRCEPENGIIRYKDLQICWGSSDGLNFLPDGSESKGAFASADFHNYFKYEFSEPPVVTFRYANPKTNYFAVVPFSAYITTTGFGCRLACFRLPNWDTNWLNFAAQRDDGQLEYVAIGRKKK